MITRSKLQTRVSDPTHADILNIVCKMYPRNKIKDDMLFGFDHNMNLDFDTSRPALIFSVYRHSQRHAAVAVNKAIVKKWSQGLG